MKTILFFSIALLCFSCSTRPRIDPEKEKDAILQADKDYSDALSKKDIQRVAMYLDDGATFITDERVYNGKSETVKMWTDIFTNPTHTISRQPQSAYVLSSGDIGYSYGPYESRIDSTISKGIYLYVWKKQQDGSWKALVLKP